MSKTVTGKIVRGKTVRGRTVKGIVLVAAAALALTGCGQGDGDEKDTGSSSAGTKSSPPPAGEVTTLKIGVSPVPHGDILRFVDENLAEAAGLDIEIVEYQDYILPNTALDEGELDGNYFQHQPYLDSQVEEFGYEFYAFPGVHIEPLGVYSDKHESLDEIADGQTIGVSNDPANQARGLRLLEQAGAIKLKDTGDADPTISDLADDTPYKVELVQLEPKLLATNLPDFDFSVINGNYAIDAQLSPSADSLALESGENNPYANFLVTQAAKSSDPALVKLNELLHTPEVRQFIEDSWADGSVIAAF
ncbi:MAG: MetQ/NlpA family ABC transporter substrate-binding protein [Bifidobacteriaceae bacterium]|jgi:D-methionine transport system substrate-binding protein|nr:MetQ/NlpA family ABC transporter substrate-binding protein [Bifidobacteriaceae bacterium]